MRNVRFYQLTCIGDRADNEDFMARVICEDYLLCIVADGLGGHHAGEKASRFFCESFLALAPLYTGQIEFAAQATFRAWVKHAIREMAKQFDDKETAKQAHTTCAILYVDKYRLITAHCGDSRIYRLSPNKIVWRSQDHSWVQKMVDAGEMTEQEMASHPEQNKLIRSINVLEQHTVDVMEQPMAQPDETFLLCSDGFWGGMQRDDWLALGQLDADRETLAEITQKVIISAEGKSDNVTVQWLRFL